MTWLDLITDALLEIGAYAPGDRIEASVMDLSQRWLNRIIDRWAGLQRYVFAEAFQVYTLTPNHAPTLIGPGLSSPDFATPNGAARPPRIEGCDLILNTSNPSTDLPMNIRDRQWWLEQRVKSMTSNVPTDLYYEPKFPNGELNFWPVPTFGYQVRLQIWTPLGQVSDITTIFAAPQGYEEALLTTLAMSLATPLSRPMPSDLPEKNRRAIAAIESNNIKSPRIASADYGAGRTDSRGGFNWETGLPV